jgi:NDP-hexose-3-ketoreductase
VTAVTAAAPVRIGVIGCAEIARRKMLPAFAAAPGTRIAAVASRDPAKAGAVAKEYGCAAVTGYEPVLERPDVDAVYVPLPASMHAEWVQRALLAGKHVLGEKPLTSSLRQTSDLVALARSLDLVLMENITFPHHSQHAKVRGLVADGAVGELRSVSSAFAIPPLPPENIRYQRDLDGGSLLDVGIHPLRAVQFFLGDELEVLAASLRDDPVHGVDVAGSVLLRAPDGVTAHVTFGMEHAYRSQYELWGSEGRIRVDRALSPPPWHTPEARLERSDGSRDLDLAGDDQYANSAQAFAEAVRSTSPGRGPWGDDSIAIAVLVDAVQRHARHARTRRAYESASSQSPTPIPKVPS